MCGSCTRDNDSFMRRTRYGWQRALIPIVGTALILVIGIGIPEVLKAIS